MQNIISTATNLKLLMLDQRYVIHRTEMVTLLGKYASHSANKNTTNVTEGRLRRSAKRETCGMKNTLQQPTVFVFSSQEVNINQAGK